MTKSGKSQGCMTSNLTIFMQFCLISSMTGVVCLYLRFCWKDVKIFLGEPDRLLLTMKISGWCLSGEDVDHPQDTVIHNIFEDLLDENLD